MDAIRNPFTPGAGTKPFEILGRDDIFEQARVLIERTKLRRPEQDIVLTGLRGVGKTVLLNEIRRKSQSDMVISTNILEVREPERKIRGTIMGPLFTELSTMLISLSRDSQLKETAGKLIDAIDMFFNKHSISASASLYKDVKLDVSISPTQRVPSSDELEYDCSELLTKIAAVANEKGKAIIIFIDEIQNLSKSELSALIRSIHHIKQKSLPLALISAGLPTVHKIMGTARSYAERLFLYPRIDSLSQEITASALKGPARNEGIEIADGVISAVYEKTGGYPYFIQVWGKSLWSIAPDDSSYIDESCISAAEPIATKNLNQGLFEVRYERLTPKEKSIVISIAQLGNGPYHANDFLQSIEMTSSQFSMIRQNLIFKGTIYSPEHGKLAFTVPLFADYLRKRNISTKVLKDS